jgi:hypothetical protein
MRREGMTAEWDWPGDDREAKPKRVAHSYRDLAVQLATVIGTDEAKDALLDLDDFWRERGQYWIREDWDDPYAPEDWVCVADAASYAGCEAVTIRKWFQRGHIRRDHRADGTPIYNIGDLDAYQERRKTQHQERAHRTVSVHTDRIDRVVENPGRWQ